MERRRHPRVGRKFGVKYTVTGQDATHVGMITNLSQGGVVLEARHAIAVGQSLELEFPESILGGSRTLEGKAVWVRMGENGETIVGCQFTAQKEDGRERRRHRRWEQRLDLKIRCVTPGPWMEPRPRAALLRDFSKGGVEIESSREYVKNLVLEMQLPESPLGPAKILHARIVWSRGASRPGHFALGLQFVRLVKDEK